MMSLFDKVTKAVGDAVDKGKAEVDQFMRIQKINGEIGEMEKKIAGLKDQIQAATKAAGEKAIELAKAGAIALPDLKPFVEQITGFEQQIATEETGIAAKKKEIEAIKAEDEAAKAKAAKPAEPAAPVAAPAAPAAAKVCSACGASLVGAGAFCPHCGAKQG
jgi:chromosome segregation ATPase